MTFDHDEDDDVLYVTFAPAKGTRYVETEHGDIVRFDKETNQIVGMTVVFFAERTRGGEKIDVPEIAAVAFSSATANLFSGHSAMTIKAY